MRTLLAAIVIAATLTASAFEGNLKDVITNPKPGIKLNLLSEGGSNGSAVAWHPIVKKYYTIIAGNEEFPMEVFDERGNLLQSSTTFADMRGLWYNNVYEIIEGNVYEFHDIVSYYTDDEGLLLEEAPYEELYELPVYDMQAVLCMNLESGTYAWFDKEYVVIQILDMESGEEIEAIELDLGEIKIDDINNTTVIYTGIEGGEYGLLNFTDKEVYLIDEQNGQVSKTIKLPKSQATYEDFNFSFANGNIWMFDQEARSWTGYAILKK